MLPTKPALVLASKAKVQVGPGIYRWIVDFRFLGKDVILRCPDKGNWYSKELDSIVWKPLINPDNHAPADHLVLPHDAMRYYKRSAALARSFIQTKNLIEGKQQCSPALKSLTTPVP